MKSNVFISSFKQVDLRELKSQVPFWTEQKRWVYMETPSKAAVYFSEELVSNIRAKAILDNCKTPETKKAEQHLNEQIVLNFLCLVVVKKQLPGNCSQ